MSVCSKVLAMNMFDGAGGMEVQLLKEIKKIEHIGMYWDCTVHPLVFVHPPQAFALSK